MSDFFFLIRNNCIGNVRLRKEIPVNSAKMQEFVQPLVLLLTELEINIKFPTCWDGVNIEDINGSHVTYSEECDGDVFNKCFDFDYPESHPVRMPEIHLYVRVLDYEGGAHVFSNDTDVSHQLYFQQYRSLSCNFSLQVFHGDYFSGWDDEMLQYLLDKTSNLVNLQLMYITNAA